MLLLACLMTVTPHSKNEPIQLTPGIEISQSCKVQKSIYKFASSDDEAKSGVVAIRGNNITVDFSGAELQGTPTETRPDERKGTGILVDGQNIVLKNVKVRGYKIGLIARNCPGLKIIDSDFSYNWKQHLGSTIEREDEADWMSYHQNEKDEWLRYGAAVYLRGCDGFEVRHVTAEGGQCGLMMTQCNKGLVWNSDFSFLSGIGIGMYRSSDNRIMHNNIDWCVRGHSEGHYNRGQDSAGILIYEQSNRNTFAYNSVTHGGDGFFLWAGQTTMDTGQGGCNDNILYGNDFSHAPTNGIEATFSRNMFVNNLVLECWHGIWGGYSFDSKVIGNVFGMNGEAIAWEHGQNNEVTSNWFFRDFAGIHLWMDGKPDPNWGYGQHRDTDSHGWKISDNDFNNESSNALEIKDTADVKASNSIFEWNRAVLKTTGANPGLDFGENYIKSSAKGYPQKPDDRNHVTVDEHPTMEAVMQPSGLLVASADKTVDYLTRFDTNWSPWRWAGGTSGNISPERRIRESRLKEVNRLYVKPLDGGKDPFIPKGHIRGRRFILVGEWGPYDFKSPILWPGGEIKDPARGTLHQFNILGPKGEWKVVEKRGIDYISAMSGSLPSTIQVSLPTGKAADVFLELEYTGDKVVSPFGVETQAGKPYRFSYSKFFAPIDWNVKFFKWDDSNDPRTKEPEFKKLISGAPFLTDHTDKLDYAGGAMFNGLPPDHYATVAEGAFEVPAGNYTFNLTTDDGARAWVDGEQVVKDGWKYQGPTLYTARLALSKGKHTIRIEHFQIDGYAMLKAELVPIRN